MTQNQIMAIVVAVLAAAAAVLFYLRAQRSKKLRERFGPEYERAVAETGGSVRGEEILAKREHRVRKLHIRALDPAARQRFVEAWRRTQARFVDDPGNAVEAADQLLGEVMSARGYPVADFEQQAADLSVNHAQVIQHYRDGHAIAVRRGQGRASTEELRQAMIHYRKLFDELVEEPELMESFTGR